MCLAEGTLVNHTKRGLVPIEHLKVGDTVRTESGDANIIEHYDNGHKKTLDIEDEQGKLIEATPNHPFRVLTEDEEITWKDAGDLQVGDYLVRKKDEYLSKIDTKYRTISLDDYKMLVNDDFAYAMGWLIGDGNTTATKRDRLTFYYNDTSLEEKEHVKDFLHKVFPEDRIKYYDCQEDRFIVLSVPIYEKLLNRDYIVRETARNKHIPQSILTLSDKLKGSFLAGLFDSDGHISKSGRNGTTYSISLSTSSKQLAQEISTMLFSMGINSSIHTVKETPVSVGRNGRKIISGGDSYRVFIQGNESKRKFLMKVGFRLPRKKEVYEDGKLLTAFKENDMILNDWVTYPLQKTCRELLQTDSGKYQRWFSGFGRPNRKEKYTKSTLLKILDMYDNNPNDENYQKIKYVIDNDLQFVKVKSITESESHTYDITLDDDTHAFIANGFVVHNTGRKIIVDSYGGKARHGGGGFSGKDATKVDRSGAYMARYIAKNLVASGLCSECEVQLSYGIGLANPLSISINTFGTSKVPEQGLLKLISDIFNLQPDKIIQQLYLKDPFYFKTASYGHFGREEFPWEKTDQVENIRKLWNQIYQYLDYN